MAGALAGAGQQARGIGQLRAALTADALLAHVATCGGTVIKPGQHVFWGGYSGYFTDPDGFLWEVAHNPGFPHV